MLRVFVLLLLLANGGYYAWTQGWLQTMGLAPHSEGEPERLKQQIRPELLRVIPRKDAPQGSKPAQDGSASGRAPAGSVASSPDEVALTTTNTTVAVAGTSRSNEAATLAKPPAPPPGECLQAGIFDSAQADALRRAAAALPSGSWTLEAATLPGRWMVYMGRLADEDAVAKKRAELRELGVSYDRPGAGLEPGLSLGRFSTEEAAQRGLSNLSGKGVRSARVVQERRDLPGFMLRLPDADSRLRTQVEGLGGVMAGKALRECS